MSRYWSPAITSVAVGVPVPTNHLEPRVPGSPLAPAAPLGPAAPVAPFRFLKAKLKTLEVLPPVAVTVTAGVPTLPSTVAVGVPKPAAAPSALVLNLLYFPDS